MPDRRSHFPSRSGFTLVEAMLALLITTLIVVAGLEATGTAARSQLTHQRKQLASTLAQDLLDEILSRPLSAPTAPSSPANSRYHFTAITDYANFTESPPRDRNGNDIITAASWRRAVTLQYMNPSNPTATSASPTPLIRITVTVSRGGVTLASRQAYRSNL